MVNIFKKKDNKMDNQIEKLIDQEFENGSIAKNSTTVIDHEVEDKNNEEETNMSEKNVATEQEKKTTAARKPAAAKEEEKKPNIFKRFWNKVKENKKYILTGVGGAVVGSAATIGVAKLGEYQAKKNAVPAAPVQQNEIDID